MTPPQEFLLFTTIVTLMAILALALQKPVFDLRLVLFFLCLWKFGNVQLNKVDCSVESTSDVSHVSRSSSMLFLVSSGRNSSFTAYSYLLASSNQS
jgi:hypothetical protein